MLLTDLALDDRGRGKAIIYQRGKKWKEYIRVPNSDAGDGKADWFRRTGGQTTLVDGKQGARLEYAHRHPSEVKKVIRFPRLKLPRAKQVERRISVLVEKVFASLQQRNEARLEIGGACNELKELVGHGNWQPFFEQTLAPCGLKLRTAERYMHMARKAVLISKIASATIFPPPVTKRARKMREATKQAQAAVEAARHRKPNRRAVHLYRLSLLMPDAEHVAMDALRKLADWPRVERRIRSFLRRLCRKCGISTKPTSRRAAA